LKYKKGILGGRDKVYPPICLDGELIIKEAKNDKN